MNIYIGHIQFQTILTFGQSAIEIMFPAQMSTLSRFFNTFVVNKHTQTTEYSLASWYKSIRQLADQACVGHCEIVSNHPRKKDT